MARVCLTIEYDGTNYGGWQVQPNADSVQSQLEKALARVVGCQIRIYSSGRTDAGVHARGMRAHFDVDKLLSLTAYREGVNRYLPADIVVKEAQLVDDNFHARFSAQGKWYSYQLYGGKIRSPLQDRTAWHYFGSLDIAKMQEVAQLFVGEHDFVAFRSSSCVAKTTVRKIYAFDVSVNGEMVIFDVRGSGFLKNMVRVLVGTLVDVGIGRIPTTTISDLLLSGHRHDAGRTAPAQGLCLMKVWYEKNM